jgi:hypothetical protein
MPKALSSIPSLKKIKQTKKATEVQGDEMIHPRARILTYA